MANLNLVALAATIIASLIYVIAFFAYDKAARLTNEPYRKTGGCFFAVVIFIALCVMGINLPDYMSYIVPTTVVLLVFSIIVTFSKGKDGTKIEQ